MIFFSFICWVYGLGLAFFCTFYMFGSVRFRFGKQNFSWLVLFGSGRTVKHCFGRSLPYWPIFSDIFDLCLHWVSVVRVCKTSVLPWFCRIERGACGSGGTPHWYGGLTCQRWRCPCNSSSDITLLLTLYIVWHWFDILYVFRAQLERIMEKCRVPVVSYCWILHYVNRYVVHMCIEWVTWKQPIQIQHMYYFFRLLIQLEKKSLYILWDKTNPKFVVLWLF